MSRCARCETDFQCGEADDDASQPCWCTQLPPLATPIRSSGTERPGCGPCFCPKCLNQLLSQADDE